MRSNQIHLAWRDLPRSLMFLTAVSLHGHTLHSEECLDSVLKLAHAIPGIAPLIRRQEARYARVHCRQFQATSAWWTPPLAARQAHALEAGYITGELGLDPLVSLTDHDSIEAPMALRVLEATRDVPVSVEWSLPWQSTVFHAGIHNLDVATAQGTMCTLKAFTAHPEQDRLPELLEQLASDRGVLIVLNHPLWDETGIGEEPHRDALHTLLRRGRPWIHALELNGLRPWEENREVIALCSATGLPLISGGDRHGKEPNAVLNLTNAASFGEFVDEVRVDRRSTVFVTAHAAESRTLRIYRNLCDILRDDPAHSLGWTRWSDRVFYRRTNGEVQSLSSLWKTGEPLVVRSFVGLVNLLDHDRVAPTLRSLRGFRKEPAL